jgi:hypothetical protein
MHQVLKPIETEKLTIEDVERITTTTREAMLIEIQKLGSPNERKTQ